MAQDTATVVLHKKAEVRTAAPGRITRSYIQLSILVTVFTETFSIRETVDILRGRDRGYIKEIILLVSPRASEESVAICLQCLAQDARVTILLQKNNPGIGWAYPEGMEAARGNFWG